MEYLSINKMAEKWEVLKHEFKVSCSENWIEGAVRTGFACAILIDGKNC